MDNFQIYFSDVGGSHADIFWGRLRKHARVYRPDICPNIIPRLKHSCRELEDAPLDVTLLETTIPLNPSSHPSRRSRLKIYPSTQFSEFLNSIAFRWSQGSGMTLLCYSVWRNSRDLKTSSFFLWWSFFWMIYIRNGHFLHDRELFEATRDHDWTMREINHNRRLTALHMILWPRKMSQKCKIKHIPIFKLLKWISGYLFNDISPSTKIGLSYKNRTTNTLSLIIQGRDAGARLAKGDKINRQT